MELLKEQYLHNQSMGNSQAARAWQGAIQLLYDIPTLTPPNETRMINADKLAKRIAGHSNYHGDSILAAIYCAAEGKENDAPIRPIETSPNEKPPCYLPEKDNPYPLCEGRGMKACAHCCLWEDYDPEEDEGRVNRPLTLKQLREMYGEPVYISEIECWALVKREQTTLLFTFSDGKQCPASEWYEQVGPVYRRPPEGEA